MSFTPNIIIKEIFVALGYCYILKDLQDVIPRVCKRNMARRDGNVIARNIKPRVASGTEVTILIQQPRITTTSSNIDGKRLQTIQNLHFL